MPASANPEPTVDPRPPQVDVALLLEGTFPYVSGGVSSWVNQIVRGFPDITFGAVFIGSRPEDYGDMKYELPPNLLHLETHYLFAPGDLPLVRQQHAHKGTMADVARMHEFFRDPGGHPEGACMFGQLMSEFHDKGNLNQDVFLYSHEAWDFIKHSYKRFCTDPSFVDYFWTVRTIHSPLWLLNRVAQNMVPARAYHAVSTGYAGFLGALLKRKTGRPFILSEHGIYTKERKIDLYQAQWIKDNRNVFERDPSDVSYYRRMWIRFFEALGRLCYDAADDIVALYEINRQRQIRDGAPEERTRNIPNGVDIARFAPLREQRPETVPPVLCLIGRVVPIKDVKTFLRAMRTVVNQLPEAEGWIAGPEDEDPAYARECHDLVESLGLSGKVKFLGFQNIANILPKIGLVILSSISEALPLVVLEGFAAGVPSVTTDVGSCRQLIQGLEGVDADLGEAGRVVGISDPGALAHAALELLTAPEAWQAASTAAIRRVEAHYTYPIMFSSYRELYDKAIAWQA